MSNWGSGMTNDEIRMTNGVGERDAGTGLVRFAQGYRCLTFDCERQSHNPVCVRTYIRCEFRIADRQRESTTVFGHPQPRSERGKETLIATNTSLSGFLPRKGCPKAGVLYWSESERNSNSSDGADTS
jgi:hypothetical protein